MTVTGWPPSKTGSAGVMVTKGSLARTAPAGTADSRAPGLPLGHALNRFQGYGRQHQGSIGQSTPTILPQFWLQAYHWPEAVAQLLKWRDDHVYVSAGKAHLGTALVVQPPTTSWSSASFWSRLLLPAQRLLLYLKHSTSTIREHTDGSRDMATISGELGSGGPDVAYIGELLENISRFPPAITARKLLIQHYMAVGNEWVAGALEETEKLKALAPADPDVSEYLGLLKKDPTPLFPENPRNQIGQMHIPDTKADQYAVNPVSKPESKRHDLNSAHSVGDLDDVQQDLTTGYRNVRAKAAHAITNLLRLQNIRNKAGLPESRNLAKIQVIARAGSSDPPTSVHSPGSARLVARRIRDNPGEATSLIIADLENTLKWTRASLHHPCGANTEYFRDALVKRRNAIDSVIPDQLKAHCELGFMHVEHENLKRNYVNDETMLGDVVKDIPRDDFYVTEDNYAWSMGELVQAIQANSGVFRNPLSKEMFTPKDVKGILMHPTGQTLAAIQVEQRKMSKGVRTATIDQMEKLSLVLLADQSSDAVPSRTAVDEFLLYVATCMINFHSYIVFQLTPHQCQTSSRKLLLGSNAPPRTPILARPTTGL